MPISQVFLSNTFNEFRQTTNLVIDEINALTNGTGVLVVDSTTPLTGTFTIDGNLVVTGETTFVESSTLSVHDNMIYLNYADGPFTITNVTNTGTAVTYTIDSEIENTDFQVGWTAVITGVNPSAYNISGLIDSIDTGANSFTILSTATGVYVNGGTVTAKVGANVDLGWAGGYQTNPTDINTYAHAGIFRDATDGVFKIYEGYTLEPESQVNIDTTHSSFSYASVAGKTFTSNNVITDDVVADGNFVIGKLYNIVVEGTTVWTEVGATTGSVGEQFEATATGSTSPGTGTAREAEYETTAITINSNFGDLVAQRTYIDFVFTDDNSNETPQVRIGAQVGDNDKNALGTVEEGHGAFVIYTNNADTGAGPAGASLVERMRVDHLGNVGFNEQTGTTAKMTWDASAESLNFDDNSKAIFGAGSDLQIYHDGSNSYVSDVGIGSLILRGTNLFLQNGDGSQDYITGSNGDAVNIKHAGSTKLTTTATGVDVTGTVVSDGLTVDTATGSASPTPSKITIATSTSASDWSTTAPWGRLAFYSADASAGGAKEEVTLDVISAQTDGGVADFTINTYNSGAKERFRISHDGDISFYDDTGVSQSFFWDSSAESLGIGTSSVDSLLHLSSSSGPELRIENADTSLAEGQVVGSLVFEQNDASSGGAGISGRIQMRSAARPDSGIYFGTAADMDFLVSGDSSGAASDGATKTAMTIRAGTGNVGINKIDPETLLQIGNGEERLHGEEHQIAHSSFDLFTNWQSDTAGKGAMLTFSDYYNDGAFRRTTRAGIKGVTRYVGNNASGALTFYTNPSAADSLFPRMTIDEAGKVGIRSNTGAYAATWLHVDGDATVNTIGTTEVLRVARPVTNAVSFDQYAAFKIGRHTLAGGSFESHTRLDIDLRDNTSTSNSDTNVMTLLNNGNVGIGETNPLVKLHVKGETSGLDADVATFRSTSGAFNIKCSDLSATNPTWTLRTFDSEPLAFGQGIEERMRLDASGNLLVAGISALTTSTSIEPRFQIIGQSAETGSMYISRDEDSISPAAIYGYKSRNSGAIVLDNDSLFSINVEGSDGVGPIRAGSIGFEVDGTPATNNIPTAIVFERSNGAAGLTESMRIGSNGNVGIGTNDPKSLLHVSNSSFTRSYTDLNTVIWNGNTSIPENTSYRRLRININAIRSSARIRLTVTPENTAGVAAMVGSVLEGDIWRADGGAVIVLTSIQNGGRPVSAGAIRLLEPTTSGGAIFFGFAAGNNGTSVTYNVAVKLEMVTMSPENFTFEEVTGTTPHTGDDVTGTAFYSGDGARRLDIDSDGNVGIGTTIPENPLHVNNTTATSQILVQGDSNDASIKFNKSGQTFVVGIDATDNSFRIADNSALGTNDRLTIDISGNLLVGKTSENTTTVGIQARADGLFAAVKASAESAIFGRNTDDGNIVLFRKDGAPVGSIGTKSDSLFIHSPDGTNGAGLKITDGAVVPCNSDGTGSDNDTDFGNSGARFKDLYLSGSVITPSGTQISGTATTTTTAATTIISYAIADYSGAELTITATDTVTKERHITKLLTTHDVDGLDPAPVATQYASVFTTNELADFDVIYNGLNVEIQVTSSSTNETDYVVMGHALSVIS